MSCDVEGMEPGRAFEHRRRERPSTKSDTHLARHLDAPIPVVSEDDRLYAEHAIVRAGREVGASDSEIADALAALGLGDGGNVK